MSIGQRLKRIRGRIGERWSTFRIRLQGAMFNSRGVARLERRERVLCLGDSHVRVMGRVRVAGVRFDAEPISGATASGILNPNSISNAYRTLVDRLERTPRWQHVLLHMGEVDCGFIIWHRAQRHGISTEEQLEQTLDNYVVFIGQVAGMGFKSLSVLSAPLPTITDYPSQWGKVANERKEVTASQLERTELTVRFNTELEQRCAAIGVPFVDATSEQLDPDTSLIKQHFVRPNHLDHHLRDEPYAELIAARFSDRFADRVP